MEEVLRGQDEDESQNGTEDRGNRSTDFLGDDQPVRQNENS
jgi:hypothetical protein